MTYRTHDQVASEFIAEGHRRGITERGIVICIATGLVESSLTVYANAKVPDSMALPHDAVGSDGFSVGPLQQQVVWGQNGWWWGDARTCMDPTLSAGLFYGRLVRLDYNGPNSPGSYAQAVQSSAFPDRYDERMADAQGIYDRLNNKPAVPAIPPPVFFEDNQIGRYNNFSGRSGRTVDLLIIHTEEPYRAPPNLTAQSLADLIKNSEGGGNPISYHYAIGQKPNGAVEVIDIVDTDYESWSVLDANPDSINYCFAGSSVSMSTAEWMARYGNAIDVCAYLVVQDAHKYGVPLKVIEPPYDSDPPGITDHRYVTDWLGDGTHTDVGPNFPWPYFAARINHYAGTAPSGDDVPLVSQPSASIYRESNDPLPWQGTPLDFVIDAQTHEGRVETLALQGVPKAVELVRAVAEGLSPVDDDLTDDNRAQAAAIANLIPPQSKSA
jgi:hypothetical protein